jgi:hypothetical protein
MNRNVLAVITGLVVISAIISGCGNSVTESAEEPEQIQENTEIETPEEITEAVEEPPKPIEEEKKDTLQDPPNDHEYYIDKLKGDEVFAEYVFCTDVDEYDRRMSSDFLVGINPLPLLKYSNFGPIEPEERLYMTTLDDMFTFGCVDCAYGSDDIHSYQNQIDMYIEKSGTGEMIEHDFSDIDEEKWSSTVDLISEIPASNGSIFVFRAISGNKTYDLSYYIGGRATARILVRNLSTDPDCPYYIDPWECLTGMFDSDYDWDLSYQAKDDSEEAKTAWENYLEECDGIDVWKAFVYRGDKMDPAYRKEDAKKDNSGRITVMLDENGNLAEIQNEPKSTNDSSETVSDVGYMILADGTTIMPEGTVRVADLNGAVFVVSGNETVWFAEVASQGRYRLSEDPEPNWAFYAQYNPGDKISLTGFASYFGNGSPYDYLALEFRGSKDTELGFYITQ